MGSSRRQKLPISDGSEFGQSRGRGNSAGLCPLKHSHGTPDNPFNVSGFTKYSVLLADGSGEVVSSDELLYNYDTNTLLVGGSSSISMLGLTVNLVLFVDDNNEISQDSHFIWDAGLTLEAPSASDIPITIKGALTQSAHLQQWTDSSDVVLSYMDKDGNLGLNDVNIILSASTGTQIGTASTQRLAFYGATPVIKPTALTAPLTTLSNTAPGTPDYVIQDLTNAGPYGFVTKDEGNTVLEVVRNLQTRVEELETKMQALGLLT